MSVEGRYEFQTTSRVVKVRKVTENLIVLLEKVEEWRPQAVPRQITDIELMNNISSLVGNENKRQFMIGLLYSFIKDHTNADGLCALR